MILNPPYHSTSVYKRIISVVPSQTELLSDLGLDNQIIGITKFCVHPDHLYRSVTRVGGTKTLDLSKIKSLNPDLIIANKEENNKEQIEELAQFLDVYVSDISTINDALEMIHEVGTLTRSQDQARVISDDIQESLLRNKKDRQKIDCIYLIWRDPFMTVGGDTFISDMMAQAGFNNMYKDQKRYPTITIDDITNQNPAVVFLSSEPYPFKDKHIDDLANVLPKAKITLVDGELFSWYGSRMTKGLPYLDNLYKQIS